MNSIEGLSNKLYRRFVEMNSIGGLSNKRFLEMVQWFDIQRVVQ